MLKFIYLVCLGAALCLSPSAGASRNLSGLPTCVCGDNGVPGAFSHQNVPCSNLDRKVDDFSVCNGSVQPNPCSVTGTLTVVKCTDSSTVDSCIWIRDGYTGNVNNFIAITASSYSYSNFPQNIPGKSGNLECDHSNPKGVWAVRVAFHAGAVSGLTCQGTENAVWVRNWDCTVP